MSEPRKAPARKQWLPNLMFDSETNAFAIQNLLEKEGPQFVAEEERRAGAAFVVDRLGKQEEESDVHHFIADNAGDEDDDEETQAAHPDEAQELSVAEPVTVSPTEEEIQQAAAAEQAARAEQQAQEQAAIAAQAAAQAAAEQAAQAAALEAAALAEEQTTTLETSAPVPDQTPDLTSEAVANLVATATEEARVAAHAQGHQEGFNTGYAQALSELKAEYDAKITALQSMCDGVKELSTDANALFEPLKKLAVHIAEQLVRGELTQSGQVISRLVENCLREMSGSSEKSLIVHLNPEDLDIYKPLAEQFGETMSLRPNSNLQRGSVRVSLDGAVVEDLIERRVQALSKSLAEAAPSGWRGNAGGSLASRMENRQHVVHDVEAVTVTQTADAKVHDSLETSTPPATGSHHD